MPSGVSQGAPVAAAAGAIFASLKSTAVKSGIGLIGASLASRLPPGYIISPVLPSGRCDLLLGGSQDCERITACVNEGSDACVQQLRLQVRRAARMVEVGRPGLRECLRGGDGFAPIDFVRGAQAGEL